MQTTRHTIDAKIKHNGCSPLTRVVYQYEPDVDGMAFLFVVDATILSDEPDVAANISDWAQDWLNSDGYDRARQHAESERGLSYQEYELGTHPSNRSTTACMPAPIKSPPNT
jgi:hypothetical protein